MIPLLPRVIERCDERGASPVALLTSKACRGPRIFLKVRIISCCSSVVRGRAILSYKFFGVRGALR